MRFAEFTAQRRINQRRRLTRLDRPWLHARLHSSAQGIAQIAYFNILMRAVLQTAEELPFGNRDVWYLKRLPLGDLNRDGIVDTLDIEGFLQALFDPKNFPPDCDLTLVDVNQDGAVNALDIEPFIWLLFL